MKKIAYAIIAVALLLPLGLTGCAKKSGKVKIGVAMPTQSLQRWNQDGSNMKAQLEAAGYEVDLQFGNNDPQTQVNQIENMIAGDVKALVISAINGSGLTEVLKQAKEKNIAVIAYDRLIMNSDAVSYYATFDNNLVGVMQGQFIESKFDLKNAPGPFTMEFVTGDAADNNVNFFFGGAQSVLRPYIDSGKIKVPSGKLTLAQCATPNWSTEEAQKEMENKIQTYKYLPGQTKLDAVVCSNDSTAVGVANALASNGFTKDDIPVITGQDCDTPAVKNMLKGLQAMSVFKDTRTLASKVVGMVDAIIKGTQPEVNDTGTYDNGVIVVPSYLCAPVVVTLDNYKEMLIDSGYYEESAIQ